MVPTTGADAALTEAMRRLTDRMTRGVLAFPVTPFSADGSTIDLPALRAHIGRHLDTGAAALFVACGTGEFAALAEHEYADVVAATVSEVAGQVPVVAGAGYGWAQAARFSAIAERAGVDGLLSMPPYLGAGTQQGLVEHVRRVAAATSLPVIVYQRDTMRLTVDSLVEIAAVPNVMGLKDGHADFLELHRMRLALPPDFLFFNGSLTAELQYRPYASIGMPIYSSAVQSFVPEIARAFFTATRSGDDATMDKLITEFYAPLVSIRDRVPGYAISLVKAGSRLRGHDVGPVRAPLVDPSEADLADLQSVIDRGLALVGG